MPFFPQLSSGAISQWPIQKRMVTRTIVNEAADGSRWKYADASAGAVRWALKFPAITDDEKNALTRFFQQAEGRLGSFGFLDPTENLLRWSEKLDEAVWESIGGLLTVESGIADPTGGTAAARLRNTSTAALKIMQAANCPAWFHYAFSLQAKAEQGGQVTLIRETDSDSAESVFPLSGNWQMLVLSGKFESTAESVRFGVEVAPGGVIDVFGLQAEAQPGASAYKKTESNCGIYPQARFDEDALSVTAEGPDRNSCLVKIFSTF